MKFTEVTVHTTSEGSELVADVMWRYSNYGVAISDVKDVIALQRDKVMYWDYMDEDLTKDTGEALVKAFVTVEDAPAYLPEIRRDIEEVKKNCGGCLPLGSLEITTCTVEGDDWIEIWRKHFRPIHIGGRVVVVPEWIKYEKQPGEAIVRLDSNMAFGTGEHETTSMCLELLQEYLTPESVCLDVGCGSGILGISAVLLGAKYAYLTDIDPVATASAEHNCALNGVFERLGKAYRPDWRLRNSGRYRFGKHNGGRAVPPCAHPARARKGRRNAHTFGHHKGKAARRVAGVCGRRICPYKDGEQGRMVRLRFYTK